MSTDAGVTTLAMPCATSASLPVWECRPEKCGWWEVGGFTESIVFSPRRVERKIRRLRGLIMRKMRTTRSLLEKWEVVAHQQVGVVTRAQQLTNVFC